MICIETQYFNLHRILLKAVGLWPLHRTKLIQFHTLLFFLTITSFVFYLTTFLTKECTIDYIITILSIMLFFILCITHYNSFWIKTYAVKRLLEQLQEICNELRDENEIAIIKKYGNSAKRITIVVTLIATCGLFLFSPIVPRIYSIVSLINKSEASHNMQTMTEYSINQEKKYYLILLHLYSSIYIAVITLVGAGMFLIGFFIHVCGLFSIASFRIERAMMIKSHEKINLENNMKMVKKISCAVDVHRKAIECIEFFVYYFDGTFFIIIVVTVISLSLNLFRVVQTALLQTNIIDFVLHFMCAFIIIIYFMIANYTCQEIIDHYNYIFCATYNIGWYAAPIRIQKLILFLLERSCKPFSVKIGGLFVPSLEGLASLLAASISYFTVMVSMQQRY